VSEGEDSEALSLRAEGKIGGLNLAARVVGYWAAPVGLAISVFSLLLWGDQGRDGTRLALYLALVLLGVTLGIAFTARMSENWKEIARERKLEIDRMAAEKNALSGIRNRQTSNPKRKGKARS